MATFHISTNTTTQTIMLDDDDLWIVDPGVSVSVSGADNAFFGGKAFTGNEIRVQGTVEANGPGYAFNMLAKDTKITVGSAGEITAANIAVFLKAAGSTVVNKGDIDGENFAIRFGAQNAYLKNEGTITSANTAVYFHGTRQEVENFGSITGKVGISSDAGSGETFKLFNSGTLTGSKYAFVGSAAKETIINTGTIDGDVFLRDGNDVFDFRSGSVNGGVFGGNGKDTYILGATGLTIVEDAGGGIDTVRSAASYTLGAFFENLRLTGPGAIDGTGNNANNLIVGTATANLLTGLGGNDRLKGGGGEDQLLGGAGNDRLAGGGGMDKLTGGKGNDLLTGGAERDTFVFAVKGGEDHVTDFTAGGASGDIVDISSVAGIVSFQDLTANHMTQVGADVVITFSGSKIFLEDVDIADLSASDFLI